MNHATSRPRRNIFLRTLGALLLVLGFGMMLAPSASAGQGGTGGDNSDKVYVCKYVGTPGVDERLQTGQNPIDVSVNSIKDYHGVGSYFADKQGRSYVLATSPQYPEPTVNNCPSSGTSVVTTTVFVPITKTEQVPTTTTETVTLPVTTVVHDTTTETAVEKTTETTTLVLTTTEYSENQVPTTVFDTVTEPTTVTQQNTVTELSPVTVTDVATERVVTTVEVPVTVNHNVVTTVQVPATVNVPVTVTKVINGAPKTVTVTLKGNDTTVYGATVTVTDCPPGVKTPDSSSLAYTGGGPLQLLTIYGSVAAFMGLILLGISTRKKLRGTHS